MRAPVLSAAAIVLFAGLALLPQGAQAGTVSVKTEEGRITIEAIDAAVDEVLTRLGEAQGFELQVSANASRSDVVSGWYEGSLQSVLSRLLHNESHMIVYSADSQAGIARIVLFGAGEEPAGGTPAPTPTPVAAPPPANVRGRNAPLTVASGPRPLPREIIPPAPQQRPVPQPPIKTRSGVN